MAVKSDEEAQRSVKKRAFSVKSHDIFESAHLLGRWSHSWHNSRTSSWTCCFLNFECWRLKDTVRVRDDITELNLPVKHLTDYNTKSSEAVRHLRPVLDATNRWPNERRPLMTSRDIIVCLLQSLFCFLPHVTCSTIHTVQHTVHDMQYTWWPRDGTPNNVIFIWLMRRCR